MNVFITGSTGFLGRNLLKELILEKRIKKIYCINRSSTCFTNPKVVCLNGDLNLLSTLIIDDELDVAIHLAAYLQSENMEEFNNVNVTGTNNIVSFCNNNNIKRIIHCSTINVKMINKGGYATTKKEAEDVIVKSGLEYVIVRPTLIYGSEDKGLNKIIKFAKTFHCAPCFGDGKHYQQPIYIMELVNYFMAVLFSDIRNATLELGGNERLTYIDMVNNVALALNKKVILVKVPLIIILSVIKLAEKFKLKFPLRAEQIMQNNEDLICNNTEISELSIPQKSFLDNLKEYV